MTGRILGIDPGLNISGYGLIEVEGTTRRVIEAGVIRTTRGTVARRVAEIFEGLTELIRSLKPTEVALEDLYSHYERPKTAILMGHARGVICLAVEQAGLPLHHYAATQIKRLVAGSGRAPKSQIQSAICREFGLSEAPEPPDVADAIAIALCHHVQQHNRNKFEGLKL